jgi:hypothetical protein
MPITVFKTSVQNREYPSYDEALLAETIEANNLYIEEYKISALVALLNEKFVFIPRAEIEQHLQKNAEAPVVEMPCADTSTLTASAEDLLILSGNMREIVQQTCGMPERKE